MEGAGGAKVGWERPLERLVQGTDLEGKREPGWGSAGRRAAPSETGWVEKYFRKIALKKHLLKTVNSEKSKLLILSILRS